MDASIVICTYNRSRLLERLLLALSKQTLPPERFEVIIVDDGSADDTQKVFHDMQPLFPNNKYILLHENEGLAVARNKGIETAEADNLLFIDDDCIPRADWVETLCAALGENAIVAGAVESAVSPFILLCHNIAEFHGVMPGRAQGHVSFIAGANMGIKRFVLTALKGFKSELRYAQDMELALRARSRGYRILFAPEARALHAPPDRNTFTRIVCYTVNHARATVLLRNQYQQLLFTPLILRHAVLTLLTSPIIAFGVTIKIYVCNPTLAKFFWTAPMIFGLKMAWCWGAAQGLIKRDRPDG